MLILTGFEASAEMEAKSAVEQWRSYQYGMFIHYGMSTYTDRDLDPGDKPSTVYAPTHLDVDQWIRVARDAGMKYAVLTAKHVPGHCLWDSKVQWRGKEFDYDVASSGNKTDVVKEFVKACTKYDVAPGLYWCLLDWRNNSTDRSESWRIQNLPEDFFKLAKDQLEELLANYPEVSYLWIDIPRAASAAQRSSLYNHIKQIKSDCIVLMNHGTTKPSGPITIAKFRDAWPTDILNTERWPIQAGWFEKKQMWQGRDYELGYEHCDTICQKWFWHEGDAPKPAKELYNLYKQTRAAGGNFLLNVPPDKSGRIPDYHVRTLMDIKKMIGQSASSRERPTPEQIAWHELAVTMFTHFEPAT
jgi:alpha-L-fucosidase